MGATNLAFSLDQTWLFLLLFILVLIGLDAVRSKFRPYRVVVLQKGRSPRPTMQHVNQKIEAAWGLNVEKVVKQSREQDVPLEILLKDEDQKYVLSFVATALPLKLVPQRFLFSLALPDLLLGEVLGQHGSYWELSIKQGLECSAKHSLRRAMKLIANLIDDDSLLVGCLNEGVLNPLTEENRRVLEGDDASDLITKTCYVPKCGVTRDSIEMAKTKAQESFSQFASAFHEFGDEDHNDSFCVRIELVEDNRSEHIWLAVESIDGDNIIGIMDSDPMVITTIEKGQNISLTIKQVEDWFYYDGEKMMGAYSVVKPFG